MTALEQARALRLRGLSVFPIPVGTKKPIVAWKPYQDRLATDDELVAWFRDGPANIGVVTGAISGAVVVDVDARDGLHWVLTQLPDTPWKTRTAKGAHFWFQHPGGTVRNRTRLRTDVGQLPVDVRGDGGFVVAPGSVHPSGAVYRAAGDWTVPRAELPWFDCAWIAPPATPEPEVANRERPLTSAVDVVTRARAYLAKMPQPEIGGGSDHATFIAACRLVRAFALTPSDADALLWEWCGNRPGWTRDWVTQKIENALEHGSERIGALL